MRLADQFIKAVKIVSADANTDGILVIVTPQAMTDPTAIAKGLEPLKKIPGKPILAAWMGASLVTAGEAILKASGIPTFQYPETAVRAFCYMYRYNDNLSALYETPALGMEDGCDYGRVEAIIRGARKTNRTLLTELESKQVLDAYAIPTVETHLATSEDQAVKVAAKLGGAVVLKVYSETVTHKTAVGGVKLDLRSENDIRQAYREIEGSLNKCPRAFLGVTVEPMVPFGRLRAHARQ